MRGTSFSICDLVGRPSLISHTRSRCSRAAMMLSSFDVKSKVSQMTIGKAGQIPNISFTRFLLGHSSRKFRRHGDAKTTYRHLRHTCASLHHASYECLPSSSGPYHGSKSSSLSRYKSKISRRTSSDSISIATFQRGGPILSNSVIVPRDCQASYHTPWLSSTLKFWATGSEANIRKRCGQMIGGSTGRLRKCTTRVIDQCEDSQQQSCWGSLSLIRTFQRAVSAS